jgi:hypothetical protein
MLEWHVHPYQTIKSALIAWAERKLGVACTPETVTFDTYGEGNDAISISYEAGLSQSQMETNMKDYSQAWFNVMRAQLELNPKATIGSILKDMQVSSELARKFGLTSSVETIIRQCADSSVSDGESVSKFVEHIQAMATMMGDWKPLMDIRRLSVDVDVDVALRWEIEDSSLYWSLIKWAEEFLIVLPEEKLEVKIDPQNERFVISISNNETKTEEITCLR